ncbi:MAG: proton-conducting transporter membrane subunit [Candidatus Omnitrophota bacterium]|nr:proton-conducting transporter membrane subunit [Candidatus Omnitrophota bacterium]
MVSLFILAPFAAALILNLLPKALTHRLAFWVAAGLALAQAALVAFHPLLFWSAYPDPLGPFFNLQFSLDGLSLVTLLSIAIVVLATLVAGRYTITEESKRFNFTNLVLITLMGMNAVAMTTDLFSLYVFLEVCAIALFILIALKKDKLALEGAFKYLILSAIATVLMLFSIALFLLLSGGVSFSVIYGALSGSGGGFLAKLAMGLFLCGLFIKAGLAPFHAWLPDAHSSAPSAASVLLSGMVTKIPGAYILMRLVTSVFPLNPQMQNLLMFVGVFSIIIGAQGAFYQHNFKRMLAYSSVSQVGYIVLALGCGTPLAFAGAAFHLFNDAISKTLLFVNACCLEKETGTVDMDKMGGLGQRMPITNFSCLVGAFSAAGLPPLAGFWSKFIIILALMQAGKPVYATVAILASILTLGYALVMQRKIFFGGLADGLQQAKEAGIGLVLLESALALVVIAVGIGFAFMYNNFMLPVGEIVF